LLASVPVLPIVTLDSAATACDLARAICAGGIAAIEVTLRTPESLAAIDAIARGVPEIIVGAGTVLSVEDLRCAARAGAQFAVSPGSTTELLESGNELLPYLPGIATASEIQRGIAAGYNCFKFFPAAGAGGIAALRAFAGPFPRVQWCATGGITAETAGSYLALPNVITVGGSWIASRELVRARDWAAIEMRARDAAGRIRHLAAQARIAPEVS
jgi:2-dehydro-3-deoxyphosphogluconate aldolase/(4S)-4-hydroxy-2-oxoglutarate aldolase